MVRGGVEGAKGKEKNRVYKEAVLSKKRADVKPALTRSRHDEKTGTVSFSLPRFLCS
jgi:hypothetical protein